MSTESILGCSLWASFKQKRTPRYLLISVASVTITPACALTTSHSYSLDASNADVEDCSARFLSTDAESSELYVTQLAMGLLHHCALMSDQTVRCRGENIAGELGTGNLEPQRAVAATVPGLTNVAEVQISTIATTCARTISGEVWCWGRNENGQIGNGHSNDENCQATVRCRLRPTQVMGIPPATHLAMGDLLSCVIGNDHSVWCWGTLVQASGDRTEYASPMRFGQFGDLVELLIVTDSPVIVREGGYIETTLAIHPQTIPPGVRLRANQLGTFCFVLADHTVRCLGNNFRNMVGIGTTETGTVASPYDPGVRCVEDVVPGTYHTCVLHTDGHVRCWGDNGYGQTGEPPASPPACGTSSTGPAPCTLAPVLVAGLDRVSVLALGTFVSCAIRDDHGVWCWGSLLGNTTAVPIRVEW